MAQSRNDPEIHLQSLVAAVLTVAVIGNQGTTPEDALRQYEEVLRQLRVAGGPITPVFEGTDGNETPQEITFNIGKKLPGEPSA